MHRDGGRSERTQSKRGTREEGWGKEWKEGKNEEEGERNGWREKVRKGGRGKRRKQEGK